LCPKGIKTHLHASVKFKKFSGVIPPDPVVKGRREKGRRVGSGREDGKMEGRMVKDSASQCL
jgi:hypothetical protein